MEKWSIEWWHLVIVVTVMVIGALLRGLTGAFRAWASTLDKFKEAMQLEMTTMRRDQEIRMSHIEKRFDILDERMRQWTLDMERRLTWVEAHTRPFRGHESPLDSPPHS